MGGERTGPGPLPAPASEEHLYPSPHDPALAFLDLRLNLRGPFSNADLPPLVSIGTIVITLDPPR